MEKIIGYRLKNEEIILLNLFQISKFFAEKIPSRMFSEMGISEIYIATCLERKEQISEEVLFRMVEFAAGEKRKKLKFEISTSLNLTKMPLATFSKIFKNANGLIEMEDKETCDFDEIKKFIVSKVESRKNEERKKEKRKGMKIEAKYLLELFRDRQATFSDLLRGLRLFKEFSQEELSKKIGRNIKKISLIESGQNRINQATLEKIIKELDLEDPNFDERIARLKPEISLKEVFLKKANEEINRPRFIPVRVPGKRKNPDKQTAGHTKRRKR